MNKVQMMLTGKINSHKCNPKNVKSLSTAVTACAFALTLGSVMVLSTPSANAAGQVIGGYTAGNQALGDGSVVVSGGKDKAPNLAEGENSAVLGGTKNMTEGPYTAIVGGFQNIVHEEIKNGVILGGTKNQIEAVGTLVGDYATISGGEDNIAYGESSSISGGNSNGTYGLHSSIAGGRGNNAAGEIGSVIGGSQNNADGKGSTLAGGLGNTGVGMWSSVFGGSKNEAVGTGASILGGGGREFTGRKFVTHKNIANGEYSTIVGSRDAMTVGNGSTVVGGSNGMTLGLASTSVGGGFTGATEEGTIAFGHDAGDVSGYTVKYPDKEITTHLGYKKTVPDYDKEPTITPTTYTDAKYNRLVKVADGVDAHDAATVGQLESAISQVQSVGSNLETTVNKATASSYALAALQPNFSEGETGLGVAVGFGHYHGKTATALGAYYRPSRNVQFNVGTVVGNGNQGFNGGLSFKVGSESKSNTTSTDERMAQLEKRIQELEQSKK